MDDPKRSLQYLQELEAIGEDILRDRQEIVALDRRRHHNREGLSALSKVADDKTWFTLGPMLVKMPVSAAQKLVKDDQAEANIQINKLRSELKVKVNRLRDMEHQPPVPGLTLSPLDRGEMQAMGQVLGRHSH